MSNTSSIFLSYCWANRDQAKQIFKDLMQIGVPIKMDTHQIEYKDDLNSFMESIRDTDYAILLISDDYLKSVNCMFEVSHLSKEKEYHRKILPVVLDGTSFFKPKERLKYIQFWEQELKLMEEESRQVDPVNAIEILKDVRIVKEIVSLIDGFLSLLSSMMVISFSQLRPTNYAKLLKATGFLNITYLTDLLKVASTKDIDKRELLLDRYLTKHGTNSYYYTSRAVTYERAGKFEQAKFNYHQAIALNDENYEALNNLGLLYHFVFQKYDRAKEFFEKAIEVDQQLTVARLNLGVLLSHEYQDDEAAKDQYLKILEYDPTEVKALNNLGNYYKSIDPDKAEELFRSAIDLKPDYVEAYMNYANLLTGNGRKDEGAELYKRALELDENGHYTPIINALMETGIG